jgi:hypothetical protein
MTAMKSILNFLLSLWQTFHEPEFVSAESDGCLKYYHSSSQNRTFFSLAEILNEDDGERANASFAEGSNRYVLCPGKHFTKITWSSSLQVSQQVMGPHGYLRCYLSKWNINHINRESI